MFGAEIPLLSTGVDAGLLPGGQLANIAIVVLCLLVVAFWQVIYIRRKSL